MGLLPVYLLHTKLWLGQSPFVEVCVYYAGSLLIQLYSDCLD